MFSSISIPVSLEALGVIAVVAVVYFGGRALGFFRNTRKDAASEMKMQMDEMEKPKNVHVQSPLYTANYDGATPMSLHLALEKKVDENQKSTDQRLDHMQKNVTAILVSVSRIEGKMERR